MKKLQKKQFMVAILSALLLLSILLFGPLDLLRHGCYYNEINMEAATNDLCEPVDLSQGNYEMHFSPVKKYFAGIEILLTNQPADNTGRLIMTIRDDRQIILDTIEIDLSKVKDNVWYKTCVSADLKQSQTYTLTFSVEDCHIVPSLVTIDTDYLMKESLDGNVALGYAYKDSTFQFPTKVLIFYLRLLYGSGHSPD